jgi:hypothetical protein
MSLPKINYPLFDVTIPSTDEKIKMRPFLVKEEKILLMAQTTGSAQDIVTSITQVVNNCIVGDININTLTTFDLEYLFIKLRARSVNNKIDVLYKDDEDGLQHKLEVDLDKIEISRDPEHNNNIKINDNLGLILRYPRTDMMKNLSEAKNEVDLYFEVVKNTIEKIYDADSVYNVSDYTEEELDEFLAALDVGSFKQVQKFLETMPKLKYEATYTNSLGNQKTITLSNLNDFFMLG